MIIGRLIGCIFQVAGMSLKMEDIKIEGGGELVIEDFKHEPIDIDENTIADGIDPQNSDQKCERTEDINQEVGKEYIYIEQIKQEPTIIVTESNDPLAVQLYSCDLCEYTGGSKSSLYFHKKTQHEGIRYRCDQCDFAASQVGNLQRHIESKHKGIKYSCDQCESSFPQLGHLKQHKEAKHEGIRYPCDQCNYAATQLSSLKLHKQSKHEGIRYPCDQCEYTAAQH